MDFVGIILFLMWLDDTTNYLLLLASGVFMFGGGILDVFNKK